MPKEVAEAGGSRSEGSGLRGAWSDSGLGPKVSRAHPCALIALPLSSVPGVY